MFMTIYGRAFQVLMKKPLKLWGISLLAGILSTVLTALCGVAIPGLGLAVSLLLSTSMTMVYLHGYRGEDVQVLQLFDCFKSWETIKRVVLGLAWMLLWVFLWGLIPVVGPIFALIRTYEYRLTPYILITEPDIPVTEAIKISKQRTEGYKAQMWLADIVHGLAFGAALIVLGLLSAIPVLGVLFALVVFVLSVVYAALSPLFSGLVQAAFYEEISNGGSAGASKFCGNCGQKLPANAVFCSSCGKPVE